MSSHFAGEMSLEQLLEPEACEDLANLRAKLSPRLVFVLKIAEVWTRHAKPMACYNFVPKRFAKQLIEADIVDLETLGARNVGITPTRLTGRPFMLKIGTATRLKKLASDMVVDNAFQAFIRKNSIHSDDNESVLNRLPTDDEWHTSRRAASAAQKQKREASAARKQERATRKRAREWDYGDEFC